jgi:hypothetical protein
MSTTRPERHRPVSDQRIEPSPWRPSVPLFVAGGVSIIAGGLTAAVTGPTGWERGSWVAAFLVLVAGAGQIGIGVGQSQLTSTPLSVRSGAGACVLWNSGCALVIAGTLLSSPVAVTLGGAPLVAVLVMAATSVRGGARRSHLALAYRAFLIILLVSVPVGLALAWARN